MSGLRVDDIRPDELMERKRAHLEADQEWLRERRSEFVSVVCVGCGGDELEPAWEKLGFSYQRCRDCRTVLMNPRAPEAVSHEFYARSENYAFWNKYIFPASDDVRRERIFRPRVERMRELCEAHGVAAGGTLLEVGAGFGTFCDEARASGAFDRVIAVEPTPELAATCRERGLETIESPLESSGLEEGSADVAAAFEVLEHVFDPLSFVREIRRVQRPGGLLILSVPNIEGFDTLVLGRDANAVDHEHVNYFNPESLGTLLERAGYEVAETLTPGRLDVDLVGRAVEEGAEPAGLDGFLGRLLDSDPDVREAFQDFLAGNGLSSHLWAVGRAV